MDPGVHVLQIDLTPTNTSTSPKLVHALLISLILNDSKTDRHNNTAMTQQHNNDTTHISCPILPH